MEVIESDLLGYGLEVRWCQLSARPLFLWARLSFYIHHPCAFWKDRTVSKCTIILHSSNIYVSERDKHPPLTSPNPFNCGCFTLMYIKGWNMRIWGSSDMVHVPEGPEWPWRERFIPFRPLWSTPICEISTNCGNKALHWGNNNMRCLILLLITPYYYFICVLQGVLMYSPLYAAHSWGSNCVSAHSNTLLLFRLKTTISCNFQQRHILSKRRMWTLLFTFFLIII